MKKMTKTAVALLLALTALLSCAAFAQAADGSVTYDGNAQDFIFAPGSDYSPTDLFPDFKGLLPGDTLTQKITVKNDASKAVKVRIYLRSLGAQEGSEELLSYLKLTVTQDGSTKLFEAPAAQTAQLTDWVSLGTLYSGGTPTLRSSWRSPRSLATSSRMPLAISTGNSRWRSFRSPPPTRKPAMKRPSRSMLLH